MAVVKRTLPAAPKAKSSAPVSRPGVAAPAFTLPTDPSVPSTDMGDYSILLFGDKKIGKTSLAAQFPNALFLMTEPGAKALAIHQVNILTWDQLKQAAKVLVNDRRFKTIVVDTVDIAFKMCERSVCQRLGIDHPSEEDWGKGWSAVRDEFTAWAQTITNMGKGVIFISHAVEREIKSRSGMKYDRFQPTMSGQARDVVEGMVDIWAYYTYDETRRMLIIRGDEHIMAGHRLQQNFQWDGREVRSILMDPSPTDGYHNLIAAFHNQYDGSAHRRVVVGRPAKGAKK